MFHLSENLYTDIQKNFHHTPHFPLLFYNYSRKMRLINYLSSTFVNFTCRKITQNISYNLAAKDGFESIIWTQKS